MKKMRTRRLKVFPEVGVSGVLKEFVKESAKPRAVGSEPTETAVSVLAAVVTGRLPGRHRGTMLHHVTRSRYHVTS